MISTIISSMESGLNLRGIKKIYADFILDISFSIKQGEFVSLVGPSGCGKTTTLSIISGLLDPDEGKMSLNGKDLLFVPIWERNIGFVFQDYALFPNMNIENNIGYGLKVKKVDKSASLARTNTLLDIIGLTGYNKRSTEELSGGEKQRVALARALAPHPELLLLDEPLSALDAQLRKSLRKEIRSIQKDLTVTTIYVTHDQEEALSISDRIIMINNGSIEQIGTPEDIYSFPKTKFSAEFFGRSTMLPVKITNHNSNTCTVSHKNHTYCTNSSVMHYFKRDTPVAETKPETGHLFFRPENAEIFHVNELDIDLDLERAEFSNIFLHTVVIETEYSGNGYFVECNWEGFELILFSKIRLHKGSVISVKVPIVSSLFIPD
ncbi:MAG: ABC transporter ATP-binding protein [Spirochaetia bacterium]|nr:ABC transporter ATP-binding protein [Spirochaetia bacterium]